MFQKIKNNQTIRAIFETKNLGLYAVFIIALSVTWSSIKIIEKNYQLEKQITQLQQEVSIQDQTNKNQKLKNEYFKTDAYLELAARKYFGKANPGEKLVLVPAEVSQKYIHPETEVAATKNTIRTAPKFIQNFQDWINFFLHREPNS
ncbi:MAG: septum formation initiator family protein [Candidatus Saccharimonadales bacterium]